jgi:putative endonuclease
VFNNHPTNKVQKGREAEQKVLKKYLADGYQLVARNFQHYGKSGGRGRKGEIDLILSKDQKLVLVEVKYRFNLAFGSVLEQITIHQLKAIFKAYQFFLLKPEGNLWKNKPVRLDIAVVEADKIQILENATTFDGLY